MFSKDATDLRVFLRKPNRMKMKVGKLLRKYAKDAHRDVHLYSLVRVTPNDPKKFWQFFSVLWYCRHKPRTENCAVTLLSPTPLVLDCHDNSILTFVRLVLSWQYLALGRDDSKGSPALLRSISVRFSLLLTYYLMDTQNWFSHRLNQQIDLTKLSKTELIAEILQERTELLAFEESLQNMK